MTQRRAGREAATPAGLMQTVRALYNLGIVLADWGREPGEVETAYRDAAAAGREAATPEGLLLTAQSLSNLGNALASWGRPQQEIEAAYREVAAAGREAAIPGRIGTDGTGAVCPRVRLLGLGAFGPGGRGRAP